MNKIEVDFEVYKQLTVRRETEDVTENDVIRKLLGLGKVKRADSAIDETDSSPNDWLTKGVLFPSSTEFRARYKGQIYTGRVEHGVLVVNGKTFNSPSAAAIEITGNPVNGWRFWECRLPSKASWQLIETLRK